MNNVPPQPRIKVAIRPDYREQYANSVQIRPTTWDFFLQFGTIEQKVPEEVEIHMFQGIYLSPQQAKAVLNLLQSHVVNYEKTFGEIQLAPLTGTGSIQ
jgi:flagellar protein FlaG